VVLTSGNPVGYGQAKMEVQAVTIDSNARVQPVVMQTQGGDSIIWVVEEPAGEPAVKKGEESEELGSDPVPATNEKKAGEL
jgi:hypothetical protein